MTTFTEAEIAYLVTQPLGRLATLGPDGAPQTRPVGFRYDPDLDTIDIGGRNLTASRKFRNILADPRVSFVVDDLASTNPWRPRGVEVRGTAEAITADGGLIRIRPHRILGWGLDTDPFESPNARNV